MDPSADRNRARWSSYLFGVVGFALVHAVLPWVLSSLTRRHGWSERRPGWWNLPGLVLIAAGGAFAIWGLILHSSEGWQWTPTQKYFLRRGPYRFSRNPMYLGEPALWLGWAMFFGSVPVLLGFITWCAGFIFLIVPSEERGLEERYGESYRQFKRTVPRWFGKV